MKDKTYVTIPSMSGTDGDASVVLINATFQVENDSEKRFPHLEFGDNIIVCPSGFKVIHNESIILGTIQGHCR
jgi:hypothetical protein